jgi:hypothetical protein
MNLRWSFRRGMNTGAVLGGFGALAFALGVTNAPVLAPLTILGYFAAGSIAGGFAGGATFATTHAIVHGIPGLARATGEPPPPPKGIYHTSKVGRSSVSVGPAAPVIEETNDRNTGFRRMIEESRIEDAQEMQR